MTGPDRATAASLLQKLAGVQTPGGKQQPAGDSDAFAALLKAAEKGEISSGLPVKIARGASFEISQEQLGRMGAALDKAQAQGATNAMVTIDGRAFEVDVLSRRVTREVTIEDGDVLTRIDAVVHAGGDFGARGNPDGKSVLPLPGESNVGVVSSVLELLAKRAG